MCGERFLPTPRKGRIEMNNLNQETIADIVADIRMQNQGLPEYGYALSPLVADLLRLADRIEAAYKNLPGMWIIPAENAKLREENERLKAALESKHSQTETASGYEYAVQVKSRGSWKSPDVGFPSLDEAKAVMAEQCRGFPNMEFRLVRRQAEWEVVK